MAEHVQATLDDMVAPLLDLKERQVFAEEEIQAILRRRRESEYAIRRREPRKADFLSYLQAEVQLEKLRKLRMKRLKVAPTKADSHILRHIHLLWHRTLRKYRDVRLYLQYADFCKEHKSYKQLSRAFAQAVQLMPNEPILWIEAASFECFEQQNLQAARVFLQRAVRVNPTSTDLWVNYLKLELHAVQKTVARRQILLDRVDEAPDYSISKIVLQHGFEKVGTVDFGLKCLDLCQQFPQTNELKDWILEHMPGEATETWIARAMNASSDNGSEEVLRQATRVVRNADMYLQAIRFLLGQESSSSSSTDDLVETLLKEAAEADFYNSDLALEYADFLLENDRQDEAEQVLKDFCQKKQSSIQVWLKWAQIVPNAEAATEILEQARKRITLDTSDHLLLLLQLCGVYVHKGDTLAIELLDRILLLFPGFVELEELEEPPFGIRSVPHACVECLKLALDKRGLDGARKLYHRILFQSSFVDITKERDASGLKDFLDEAIAIESKASCKKSLKRLYDAAIKAFGGKSDVAKEYRLRRDEELLSSTRASRSFESSSGVPCLDASSSSFSQHALEREYEISQVVHLRNLSCRRDGVFGWKDVGELFNRLDKSDKETWCIETHGGGKISSTDFLGTGRTTNRGYCSFLVQNDTQAYEETLSRVPVSDISQGKWSYETALWFFFGRNLLGAKELEGRPEHTDSVTHDGTWHYQLSGKKVWLLRPTRSLLDHVSRYTSTAGIDEQTVLRVEVTEGDMIIVNTRLWFHQTIIPPQKRPSVSYARDFRFSACAQHGGMTNLDGLYATNEIEAGTIVFRESEMPDCELHRSKSPNCEVVELEDGTSAVVSTKPIAAGEFFCIAESDEELDNEDDEDEES